MNVMEGPTPDPSEVGPFPVFDAVYYTRDGANEELRYSLRSVWEHLNPRPRRLWVFGGVEPWLGGEAWTVERDQSGHAKHGAAVENVRHAMLVPDVHEHVLLFNDDMFLMRPLPHMPVLHRGPLADVLEDYQRRHPDGTYTEAMGQTRDLLVKRGHDPAAVLSYELHAPFWITKRRMLRVFALMDEYPHLPRLHWRTLYGNMFGIGGTRIDDVKVYDKISAPDHALVSTNDYSFSQGAIGRTIRSRFPRRSGYERGPKWVGKART